jgi:hypothetical protein
MRRNSPDHSGGYRILSQGDHAFANVRRAEIFFSFPHGMVIPTHLWRESHV